MKSKSSAFLSLVSFLATNQYPSPSHQGSPSFHDKKGSRIVSLDAVNKTIVSDDAFREVPQFDDRNKHPTVFVASHQDDLSVNGFNHTNVFSTSKGFPTESILLLNLVAVIWGSQHALIKFVVDDCDPGAFTLLRFGLAALIASPYTPKIPSLSDIYVGEQRNKNQSTQQMGGDLASWRWGIEMGFWMFLGFSFQAIGLESTTAQRSGFLLYLNVKFVPFLARILLGRQISVATWLSALVAFSGTALLALDPEQGFDFNVGDFWSIAAAVASAMFILRLERATTQVVNAAGLNAACLWVVAVLAGGWTLFQQQFSSIQGLSNLPLELYTTISKHPLEVMYLSTVTTALANWIQSKAQRDVSAERASVIYAMDPVYGAIFSYWWLGEQLNGIAGWVGAALITLAAATNAYLDLSDKADPLLSEQQDQILANSDERQI